VQSLICWLSHTDSEIITAQRTTSEREHRTRSQARQASRKPTYKATRSREMQQRQCVAPNTRLQQPTCRNCAQIPGNTHLATTHLHRSDMHFDAPIAIEKYTFCGTCDHKEEEPLNPTSRILSDTLYTVRQGWEKLLPDLRLMPWSRFAEGSCHPIEAISRSLQVGCPGRGGRQTAMGHHRKYALGVPRCHPARS